MTVVLVGLAVSIFAPDSPLITTIMDAFDAKIGELQSLF